MKKILNGKGFMTIVIAPIIIASFIAGLMIGFHIGQQYMLIG